RGQHGFLPAIKSVIAVESPWSRQPGSTAAYPGQMTVEQHVPGGVLLPVLLNEENERFLLQAAPGRFRSGLQGEPGNGARHGVHVKRFFRKTWQWWKAAWPIGGIAVAPRLLARSAENLI